VKASEWEYVAQRAHFCCEYCLSQHELSHDDFSIEHIVPISKGGTNDRENLAFSCQSCNNHKYIFRGGTDPVTGESAPLYNPRSDVWHMHFAWSDDFCEIIGLTATGRATITRIQLNRPRLVNLRRALRIAGEHPPPHSL
jgi:hypothetical protein